MKMVPGKFFSAPSSVLVLGFFSFFRLIHGSSPQACEEHGKSALKAPCLAGQDICLCMEQGTLFAASSGIKHGAQINSVSFCCQPNACFLAAGGLPADMGVTTRLYSVTKPLCSLVEMYQSADIENGRPALPISTTYNLNANSSEAGIVNAVAWCCEGNKKFLALGGYQLSIPELSEPADVIVYDVQDITPTAFQISCVGGFNHGAAVNALSWLCKSSCGPCSSMGDDAGGYLAIGGGSGSNNSNIRVLHVVPQETFDSPTSMTKCQIQFAECGSARTGVVIRALDWCCKSGRIPLLAAAGGGTKHDRSPRHEHEWDFGPCEDPNVFVYTLNCSAPLGGQLLILTNTRYEGDVVNALAWCCNTEQCSSFPLLAVGGQVPHEHDHERGAGSIKDEGERHAPKNVVLYYLSSAHKLHEFAFATVADNHLTSILALGWNPTCPCNLLTIAGGCVECDGKERHNVIVYKKEKGERKLKKVTRVLFDETVTSLAWGMMSGRCSYLAVGATGGSCDDIYGCGGFELNLYKAVFCRPDTTPTDPCMRYPKVADIH